MQRAFLSPCHLYGDIGSGSCPQLVSTFHIYSASHNTIPVGCHGALFLYMKPGRLNKHNQPCYPSLFRALKVFCWSKYDSGGSNLTQYDILNWGISASQHICNSNFCILYRTSFKMIAGVLKKTSTRKLCCCLFLPALAVFTVKGCWSQWGNRLSIILDQCIRVLLGQIKSKRFSSHKTISTRYIAIRKC